MSSQIGMKIKRSTNIECSFQANHSLSPLVICVATFQSRGGLFGFALVKTPFASTSLPRQHYNTSTGKTLPVIRRRRRLPSLAVMPTTSVQSAYYGLNVGGGCIGLVVLLLTTLFARDVKRQPVLINLCCACIYESYMACLL